MHHEISLSVKAQMLLAALQKTGVNLRAKPGPQGNLWRALDNAAQDSLTLEVLAALHDQPEVASEIRAISTRYDATGEKSPVDLSFLLLALFCSSPGDIYSLGQELLSLIHARKDGRLEPTPRDVLLAQESLGTNW